MNYWDSSALVPLVVEEPDSAVLRAAAVADPLLVTWWGSRVECASAIHRLGRERRFGGAQVRRMLRDLQRLGERTGQILPTEEVRRRALRLLSVHPLRAADALQLAAAQVAALDRPDSVPFVCLDARLRVAASSEGFRLLPEDDR